MSRTTIPRCIGAALTAVTLAALSPAAASAAPFRFTAPAPRAPLSDAVKLTTSTPGAARVVYRARWKVDGVRRTRTIGTVDLAEFSRTATFTWNASSVETLDDVEVVARALDHEGEYLGTTPWLPLAPARVRAARVTSAQARVDGTCASANCRLNVRESADASARRIGVLHEKDLVTVRCRAKGTAVTSSTRGSSRIWNQLQGGGWVSDLYLTPTDEDLMPAWC